jgi:hypothetical protein
MSIFDCFWLIFARVTSLFSGFDYLSALLSMGVSERVIKSYRANSDCTLNYGGGAFFGLGFHCARGGANNAQRVSGIACRYRVAGRWSSLRQI